MLYWTMDCVTIAFFLVSMKCCPRGRKNEVKGEAMDEAKGEEKDEASDGHVFEPQ